MNSTKTGLVPDEDQGLVFVAVSTAPGNSLYATDGIMNRVEERIQQIPQVKQVLKVTGWSMGGAGNSSGIFFVRLTPWDERPEEEDHVQAVIGQIYARTGDIKDATVFAMAPGMIPGYDMGNALDIQMQDKAGGDLTEFFSITRQFIDSLNQRPELAMAFSSSKSTIPSGRSMWMLLSVCVPESCLMRCFLPWGDIMEVAMSATLTAFRASIV